MKTAVFAWGGGRNGELGVDPRHIDKENICSKPRRVQLRGLQVKEHVVKVAAGSCSSAFITNHGNLYTWGSGRMGRLGHGMECLNFSEPRQVQFDINVHVVDISIGDSHMAAVCEVFENSSRNGDLNIPETFLYTWGKRILQHGLTDARAIYLPEKVACLSQTESKVKCIDVEDNIKSAGEYCHRGKVSCGIDSTAYIDCFGWLWSYGCNKFGQLGQRFLKDAYLPPQHVIGIPHPVLDVSMGSFYCLAIASSTRALYSWGYNSTGCLGHGDRRHRSIATPVMVPAQKKSSANNSTVEQVPFDNILLCSAAVGHVSVPTGRIQSGVDGPSSSAVTVDGDVYTWGTCHKGKLGNLISKSLLSDLDELFPHNVDYPNQSNASVVQCVSGAMHTGFVTSDGQVYGMGCGSTGRLGVRQFDEGLTGKRSRMKCYIYTPTPIEEFGLTCDTALSASFLRCTQISTSRYHMIALCEIIPNSESAFSLQKYSEESKSY